MLHNFISIPSDRPKHTALQNEIRKQQSKNKYKKQKPVNKICNSKSLVYANAEGVYSICKNKDEKNGIWISFLNFTFDSVCTVTFEVSKDDKTETDYFHFTGNGSTISLFSNEKKIDKNTSNTFDRLGDIENFFNTNSKLQYKILLNRNKLSIVVQPQTSELKVKVFIPSKSESNVVETFMLAKTDNIYNPLKSWRNILFGDFRLFPR